MVEVLEMLINREAIEINGIDEHGRTPLSYAAQNGDSDVVKSLLQHEAIKVNIPDRSNHSPPIHYAILEGYDEVVRLLLNHKDTEINIVDHSGQTPLHIAARCGHWKIAALLLGKADIKINMRTEVSCA